MTGSTDRSRGWLALAAFVGTVAVGWWGLRLLASENGADLLVERLYRLVGATGSADAVAEYGLTPLTGKLILTVVALLLGVGGVWLLFLTINGLVDRLGPRFEQIVRPWVFVTPALALLAFYLVYPTHDLDLPHRRLRAPSITT